MFNLTIFIIIFLFIFVKKVPSNRVAVIFRSGKYLKTVNSNQSYFFNPFTDTSKLIDITTKNFVREFQLKSKDNRYLRIKLKYTYSVIDPLKVVSVNNFHILAENNVKKIISVAVASKKSDEILNNISIGTSKILDDINAELNKYGISAKNLSLEAKSSSTSSISRKPNPKFEKVPCTHEDEAKFTNSWSVDYSGKDSISENAIKTYELPNFSNNPIKEHHSIYSISMNTLDNEDSNVDPIQNS